MVGDPESVDVATVSDSVEQSGPERVERRRSRPEAVEEPGVGVEVDDVHGSYDGADTLLRSDCLGRDVTSPVDDPPGTPRRILVHNPASGDASHGDQIRRLADERGYEVRETESAEDIVEKAATAAAEADVVAAAGGDGTLTRAVRGLARADAFEDTLFGVVPVGTGNNFAGNVGVTGIEHGFDVIDHGDRRRIDVGLVNETPFLNSVVAGLTAEASADTEPEAKERWGTLAYAMTTAETLREFDNLRLRIEPDDSEPLSCEAKIVFVGNGRGFPRTGRTQGNVEDGLLEVAVIEDTSTLDLIEESLQAALGNDAEHVSRFETRRLEIELSGEPDDISVDGEILTESQLTFDVWERTLWLPVGDAYDPSPQGSR